MKESEPVTKNHTKHQELISILKDVKRLMDSDDYSSDYDCIYDRISRAIELESSKDY